MSKQPVDFASRELSSLPEIGAARAKKLREIGLNSLRDLLEYFPRRYQFEAGEGLIEDLEEDQVHSVRGRIVAVDYNTSGAKARFQATLDDGENRLALTWFGSAFLRGKITPGMLLRVRGKVTFFREMPQMVNPKWEVVDDDAQTIVESKFRPIYGAGAGVTSEAIEMMVGKVLHHSKNLFEEIFDRSLLEKNRLVGRCEAMEKIHRPKNHAEAYAARRRLVYDELMLLQIGLQVARRNNEGRLSAPVVRVDRLLDERIRKRFPYQLTRAQESAAFEIVRDMKSGRAMNRLLQGDVGSGKTAVALYAMLVAVANKLQSALLAPTEVLAEQHFLSLSTFMKDSGVRVELFTQRTKRESKALLESLREGEIHIAVGTQALIQKDVDFANLGLVVIDEQHRLGVRQRAHLRDKGLSPHYLVMTATPIPRTLALSFFADFDVTTIHELPPGRGVTETHWLRKPGAFQAWERIKKEVEQGHQAFVVVPRIEGDALDDEVRSLDIVFNELRNGPLNSLRLAELHGRMSSEEKVDVMNRFRTREIDVLCATTVIEVGVDYPNATVMVIESADQFGLAQLHQLRGRVGRGEARSYCMLISDAPTPESVKRLEAMVNTDDGFALAEEDLRQRGPGDFFGTRQSGLPDLKVADLTQELEMLKIARQDAMGLIEADPQLRSQRHRPLRTELLRRFGDSLGLGGIG